ncbi:SDR family NAD(P)-dependent oxidoreductase [Candidatus Bathyarchaeota archaeon]|nr:SDR family NAD(P)-dependent oxidoreductase [Candidatus Bathyarchaeota archaeon]
MTGSNTGVGKEVARILYAKHAKVYVAARSEEKAAAAIESIKGAFPNSEGSLTFLKLDLGTSPPSRNPPTSSFPRRPSSTSSSTTQA